MPVNSLLPDIADIIFIPPHLVPTIMAMPVDFQAEAFTSARIREIIDLFRPGMVMPSDITKPILIQIFNLTIFPWLEAGGTFQPETSLLYLEFSQDKLDSGPENAVKVNPEVNAGVNSKADSQGTVVPKLFPTLKFQPIPTQNPT